MCHALAEWKNTYGIKYNRFSDANDGIAFETTGEPDKKGKGMKKHIMCYKCGKTRALFK